MKPNTVKKSPQGPNLLGYVNDFLVKVVETLSLGTFKTALQKALAISVLGKNHTLAEGSNKEDFIILDCLFSIYHYEQRCNDLIDLFQLLTAAVHCRFSQPIKKVKQASAKMEHIFLTIRNNLDLFVD